MHQAVILSKGIQPAFKMAHFVPEQFLSQLLEEVHDSILGCFRFGEVFETDAVEQVEVSLVELREYFQVLRLSVSCDQDLVVGWVGCAGMGRYVF